MKKECRQYWVKKRKTRSSTDGISSQQNLSKQSQNEDIHGTAANKEDQLEIVGNNHNVFVPKNTVSCDKLGGTISTIDFEVTTDNQHVDSCIVTYKHLDLLLSFFFIALKSTFYSYWVTLPCFIKPIFTVVLVMGNKFKMVIMVKKHEAVVIKYLVQRIKTLEKSNKKLNERLKNYMCFQPVHKISWRTMKKLCFILVFLSYLHP